MMRKSAVLALVGSAAAFAPAGVPSLRSTNAASCMQMQADGVSRRDLLSGLAGAAVVAAPALANADTEYANIPYLGGSDQVDVNNANIRVYTRSVLNPSRSRPNPLSSFLLLTPPLCLAVVYAFLYHSHARDA